jgi:hypothetical protein
MSEIDMIEWIWKLYSNMVQVSGIKGRQGKKINSDESYVLSANESVTQNQGNSTTIISL